MLVALDEIWPLVHKAHTAARMRAAVDSELAEDLESTIGVIGIALKKESQAELQAGRGDHAVGSPIPVFMEMQEAVAERRIQMEADLDMQNGDMVWRVMTEDYGEAKAGEVVQVPRSEAEFIPSRPASEDEVNRQDPCHVPSVGNEIRIAAMLHGVSRCR